MAETAPPLPREKRSRRHRKAETSSPSPSPAVLVQNRLTLRQRIKRDRVMLLLTLPGLLYFIVFHYVPLLG